MIAQSHIVMMLLVLFAGALCCRAQEAGSDGTESMRETTGQVKQLDRMEQQIQKLESTIQSLQIKNRLVEQRLSRIASDSGEVGVILLLFGAFCALWAQDTDRSAWLWFFLGFFFHVITVLVLLRKNSRDRHSKRWEYDNRHSECK
jgi:hypothetical protein